MIRAGAMTVDNGEVRLREVTREDAGDLYRWRTEESARRMFRNPAPVPYPTHLAFLERYFAPHNDDRWFVVEAGGRSVGAIALYGFSTDGGEAEWGRFVIAPEHRGRGWGRGALELLVAHARRLGVRRLRCEVVAGNPRAEGLYRSLGFRDAGEQEHDGRRFVQLVAELPPED